MSSDTKVELKKIKIGDIGEVITGNTPPRKNDDYFGDAYPWIKPTDIDIGYRYVEEPDEYYSELAYKKYKKALLPPLSTCVVTIGTVGEKLCLTTDYSFTNQSINAIIPYEENFDKQFIYYLMKYNLPKVSKANPGTASGRHHVSKSNFCNIEVEVPPKEDQQRIASMLSSFDDLIENNTRRIEILEEMARRIYREWFVHFHYPGHEDNELVNSGTELGEIPEGWEVKKLGEVYENYDRYREPLSRMERANRQGEYPYYGAAKILDHIDDYLFDGEYLLMAEDGSVKQDDGSPVLQLIKEKFWVNNHTHVMQGKGNITTKFLCTALSQINVSPYITGAAQPKINQGNLNSIPLVIGDEKTHNLFDQTIKPLFEQVFTLRNQIEVLKETRDLLLPKLISGKVDLDSMA